MDLRSLGRCRGNSAGCHGAHRPKNLEASHLKLLPQKLEQKVAPKIFHLTAFTGVLGEPGEGFSQS